MKEMSDDKKVDKQSTLNLQDLERDLNIKETLRKQIENALQQITGQITCLRALIKKLKGEPEIEEKKIII